MRHHFNFKTRSIESSQRGKGNSLSVFQLLVRTEIYIESSVFELCTDTQKKTNVKRKENSSKIVFYLSVLSVPIDPFCFPLFPLLARLLWIVACLELSDDYESPNRNRNWNRNKATKLKERTVIHRCQVRSLAQVRAHLPHALFLFLFFRFLSHPYSICNISQEARTRYKTIK